MHRAASIAELGEKLSRRGRTERVWFEQWRADYGAACEEGDEEACELLVDVLVAFERWQREHPIVPGSVSRR
jgi:hypothetical protein